MKWSAAKVFHLRTQEGGGQRRIGRKTKLKIEKRHQKWKCGKRAPKKTAQFPKTKIQNAFITCSAGLDFKHHK
jgi:hypothetical protein